MRKSPATDLVSDSRMDNQHLQSKLSGSGCREAEQEGKAAWVQVPAAYYKFLANNQVGWPGRLPYNDCKSQSGFLISAI